MWYGVVCKVVKSSWMSVGVVFYSSIKRDLLHMSVGVIKVNLRELHARIHWVPRGTGTPKDRDEVHR